MKHITYSIGLLSILIFTGCKKWSEEERDISKAVVKAAAPVSDAAPLCGSIKGTMLAGKTYTISCDITINRGDTLTIQEGVHINVAASAAIVVRGTFLSLGTAESPNWITIKGFVKQDTPGLNPASDSAFTGKWKGILADTSSPLVVIKWTHLEYAGSTLGTGLASLLGLTATDPSYAVYFQNIKGSFVFEDSWIYGTTDDAIRVSSGKFAIMRSTFEKCGYKGGDVLNVKSGAVGDMAYNLFIGDATNGLKASNKGGSPVQTNIRMYNNTLLNCGYRQTKTGRGGSINFEEGSSGMAYNNLIVNCKYGLRVVSNPVADTTKLFYGYNYYYADSASVTNEIYPTTYITKPQITDFPSPVYLPSNYKPGSVYDGSSINGKNNPLFTNYPLPVSAKLRLMDITAVGSFTFTLQTGSPAISRGYTGFTPLKAVVEDAVYGATEITQPGNDIGAFQSNGRGNQHR